MHTEMDRLHAQKQEEEFEKAVMHAVSIGKGSKLLLPHEKCLLKTGALVNVTHQHASSIWLEAASTSPPEGMTNVYRPMGDIEAVYLLEHGLLPSTQPYQAIIEGATGRNYANKYLTGQKYTDSNPTTIVEFTVPAALIERLKEIQVKIEDGALSMGLGDKAGGGLPQFNETLKSGEGTFRIVKCKRSLRPPKEVKKRYRHKKHT